MSVLLLLALVQDAGVTAIDAKAKQWSVRGTADRPDGTELVIALRRIERRWDARTGTFTEFLSDETRVRGAGTVSRRGFSAATKAAPEGFYQVVIAEGETALHESRHAVARPEEFFKASRVRVKLIVEIATRAKGLLEEIAAIVKGDVKPTPKLRDDFIKRVTRDETALADLANETDLTATIALLRDALAHARNAQVWGIQKKHSIEDDDGALDAKGHYLDPDLTTAALLEAVTQAPSVLSAEIQVCIARLLTGAATKEAVLLAKDAPEPDKEFVAALESKESAVLTAALKKALERVR